MLWVPRALKGRGTVSHPRPSQNDRADHHRPRAAARWARLALRSAATAAVCGAAAATSHAAQVTWIDTVGGLWSENYRWSTFPDIPGAADDVTIDVADATVQVKINGADYSANSLISQENVWLESGTFTLATNSAIFGAFDFTGGTLAGAGDLTLHGASTWVNSSTMTGSGRTIIAGTGLLTITPGTYHKFLYRNLENHGTIHFDVDGGFGSMSMNNAVIDNKAGATFIAEHDVESFFFGETGSTNRVNNDGTFIKRGAGQVYFGGAGSAPVVFVNRGTVSVEAGTLILQTGTNHSGRFTVSSGAVLRFEGGHTFEAASSITGAGELYFSNVGNNTFHGNLDFAGLVLFAGANTHTFNGTFHAGTLLTPNGGTLAFNAAATVDQASFTNTTITGTGDLSLSGGSTWVGFGTMNGSGRTIVTSGSSFTLFGGGSEKNLERRLENHGTVNWNGVNVSAGLLLTDGTITNHPGATFNANGDQYAVRGVAGTNAFFNAGIFNKNGTGSATFNGNGTSAVRFVNTGTLNANAGALTFAAPFTNAGRVNLAGGTMTLGAGLNNTGLLHITGGSLRLGGTFTTAALGNYQNTAGAQVVLLGTLDNTAATLALSSNTGSIEMNAGSTLVGGTVSTASGTSLQIRGAATLNALTLAGSFHLAQFTNATVLNGLTLAPGATLNLAADVDSTLFFSGSQSIAGTGTVTTSGTSSATATLAVSPGDTLTLAPGILVKPGTRDLRVGSGSSTLVVQGTALSDLAGRTLTLSGTSVQNLGTFEAKDGGALTIAGPLANLVNGTLTGGTWRVSAGGTLRATAANITTNAAHVVLDGATANFYTNGGTTSAFANLSVNAAAGDFSVLNGHNFTGTGNFANHGRLTVGAASAWATPGQFTNNGTSTVAGSISSTKTITDGLLVVSGTHTVATDFVVGSTKNTARYDLDGGNLTVGNFATIGAGPSGAGLFNLTGGTFSVGKQLYVSTAGTNTSTFNLDDGTVTAGELFVAFFGGSQGVFNQNGGTVTLAGNSSLATTGALTIGLSSLAATTGTYNLNAGTLTNQGVNIGYAGAGHFNHAGGTHTVSGVAGMSLGLFFGGSGSYAMSNGAVLNVNADERVGEFGAGTFFQAGGVHTVGGAITIGANPGAVGTFNLAGGTLTASAINLLRGSFNATGGHLAPTLFSHSGGTVTGTLHNFGTYFYNSGAFAGRLINSGTVTLNADFAAANGLDNRAVFTVASNRAVTLNGLGLVNDGSISVAGALAATSATIGSTGNGTFDQLGGTVAVSGTMTLGATPGASGTYNLAGGTLTAGAIHLARGSFNLTGGTLNYGQFVQSGGTITGTLTNLSTFVYQGGSFPGQMLNSGTVVLDADLTLGLGLTNTAHVAVATNRTLTLGGGGLVNDGSFDLGGSLVTPATLVGAVAPGTFAHASGTHTAASLVVGGSATASYTLSGSAHLAVSGDTTIGRDAAGTFTQSGGVHTAGGTVTLGLNPGATGTYTLAGGTLTAAVVDLRRGTFDQTGGHLAAAEFRQSGGTVSGTLQNHGLFTYNTGAFTGRLLNSGTVTLNADLALGDGLDNQTAFDVPATRTVTIAGAGLSNPGTLSVAGTLTASVTVNTGTFAQTAGSSQLGLLTSAGAITHSGGTLAATALGNAGAYTQSGGVANLSAAVSTGSITLSGGTFAAAALVNDGLYTQTAGAANLGPLSGTGSATVSGGILNTAGLRQNTLTITNDGLVNLATSSGVAVVNVLTVSTGTASAAAFNLSNNALIVDYTGDTPVDQVRAMVASGYGTSAGHWDGPGVRSSTAAADPTLGLAVSEASTLLGLSGTNTATWMDETVDATSVLVRLTKLGDANFDGTVSFADFLRLEVGFGKPGDWITGDFDYDGTVTHADFMLLFNNYGQTIGQPAAPVPAAELRALAALGNSIPEPGALSFVALAAATLAPRRRRK